MLITHELLPKSKLLENVQILVVDNDQDSQDMYAYLLESCGATVTTLGSIKDALGWLNQCIPAILICEMRYRGESVYPLIQHVRSLSSISGREIPILIISTCLVKNLAQQLTVQVESYLLKPIDVGHFIDRVWALTLNVNPYPSRLRDGVVKPEMAEISPQVADVS